MRALSRSLVLLWLAAAAAAAAVAHFVIDIVADYAVAHASYDDVGNHGSRELVAAVAVAAAGLIALRGFRLCCDLALRRGVRAPEPPRWASAIPFTVATAGLACAAVPAMEWCDTLLAGQPLADLGDAFGGSVLLGVVTTVSCAAFVALATFALVRWLLSYRSKIVAAIVAVLTKTYGAVPGGALVRRFATITVRRRSIASARGGKRAPPRSIVPTSYVARTTLRGFQWFICSLRRAALSWAACARLPGHPSPRLLWSFPVLRRSGRSATQRETSLRPFGRAATI